MSPTKASIERDQLRSALMAAERECALLEMQAEQLADALIFCSWGKDGVSNVQAQNALVAWERFKAKVRKGEET